MSQPADLSPKQAWERLETDPETVLVDVRTRAEWSFVGIPDLTGLGKQVVPIEWTTFPDGAANPHFLDELRSVVPQDKHVLFICRSGARSSAAAATAGAAGYESVTNVMEGFEGALDADGHRADDGWKQAGLPWRQG